MFVIIVNGFCFLGFFSKYIDFIFFYSIKKCLSFEFGIFFRSVKERSEDLLGFLIYIIVFNYWFRICRLVFCLMVCCECC